MSGMPVVGMRRIVLGLLAAFCVGLAAVGGAWASSGGTDPSNAPTIGVGDHPFSACSSDHLDGYHRMPYELWTLAGVTNGDRIVIDFNDPTGGALNSENVATLLPPAADDFNWKTQEPIQGKWEYGTNKYRVTFSASAGPGRYLVEVVCSNPGRSYDFVVESIKHLVRIDVAPRPTRLAYKGVFRARMIGGTGRPVADGAVRTQLWAKWGSTKRVLATAAPTGGILRMAYALPATVRKSKVTFWIVSPETDSYLGAVSGYMAISIT